MAVPYTFGGATTSIPLSQLDSNFATTITLGNTAIQLGNTVTTLNNMTLANATVSSGNATVTTLTAPTHNSASSLTFQTNGTTTAITVDTSQNVGIGVTPSGWATYKALQVDNGAVANYSPSQDASYLSNAYYNGGWKYIASAYAVRYAQDGGGGNHRWYSAPTGTAGNAITFTQVLGVNKGTTLALEGATSASGTGIAFPATQSASSDANTLDDYEEGTWTLTDGSGAGLSFTVLDARYTKVGRIVECFAQFTYPVTANTNNSSISGLPFTTASTTGGAYGAFICYNNSSQSVTWLCNVGSTSCQVYSLAGAGVTNATLSGKQFRLVWIYEV